MDINVKTAIDIIDGALESHKIEFEDDTEENDIIKKDIDEAWFLINNIVISCYDPDLMKQK